MQTEEFLNLSYKQLEQKTNISKGTWSKYFSSKCPENPSWKSIDKISKSLDMSADQVMTAIKLKRLKRKTAVS